MIAFHDGYDLDEIDYRDVKQLCEKYGIALPQRFGPFILEAR
jgi:hypothetical protein